MRLRLLVPAVLAVSLIGVDAGVGFSGVPSPTNSSVDPCVVFCPTADLTFHVTVRDLANNPVANSTVVLDFGTCPGLQVCSIVGPGIVWDPVPRTMRMTADAAGQAFFTAHAGGVCANSVRVFADGVQLTSGGLTLTSPDQDGSLVVNFADVAIVNGKTSSPYDPTADLNCNGVVDANDVAFVQAHYAHGCTGPVGVEPQGWGRLKTIYR